jgi:hypothetical protein
MKDLGAAKKIWEWRSTGIEDRRSFLVIEGIFSKDSIKA